MDVRVGLWRKLSAEELMLLNCGVGEESWESLEGPLDCKEIQQVHSEGDQFWGFFGRNDTKAETQVLWPPHVKSWLIGKDSDAGRDWGQEKKGRTEDEMAEWHHRLDGCESKWTPGVGDGQGGLACCDSWGHKKLDMTEWLNGTELTYLEPVSSVSSGLTTGSGPREWLQSDGGLMAGILFLPELSQGSCWKAEIAVACDILVYWYIRKYSISHGH